MPKIALCLHGLSGGKNSKGRVIKAIEGYHCFKKHFFDKYDIDVFMHSWTVEAKNKMLELYGTQVKESIFEKQKDFTENINQANIKCKSLKNGYIFDPIYHRNMWSLHYSYWSVNELKKKYEKQNDFKYDWVIHSRFDLWIGNFDGIDLNKSPSGLDKNFLFMGFNRSKILEHILISTSENMNKFSELYHQILKYIKPLILRKSKKQYLNHDVLYFHLKTMGLLEKMKNIEGLASAGTFSQ